MLIWVTNGNTSCTARRRRRRYSTTGRAASAAPPDRGRQRDRRTERTREIAQQPLLGADPRSDGPEGERLRDHRLHQARTTEPAGGGGVGGVTAGAHTARPRHREGGDPEAVRCRCVHEGDHRYLQRALTAFASGASFAPAAAGGFATHVVPFFSRSRSSAPGFLSPFRGKPLLRSRCEC